MSDAPENWKPVPGRDGLYEVSDLGRLYSHVSRRMLALCRCDKTGHLGTQLGRGHYWQVHRLVMLTFVGPRPQGLDTRHLNGKADDNRLVNLEYATRGRNKQDQKWHRLPTTGKLTGERATAMKKDLAGGMSLRSAAEKYEVSIGCVSHLKSGRTHADV